jgi:hypothetical protein
MRFDRRKRREFITLLGGAAVSSASWPSLVRAQSAKAARVGFLGLVSALKSCAACGRVGEGLRDLGWIEGRNLIIEFRWAEGRTGALCREISLFSPCRRGRAHRHSGRMILIAGRVHHGASPLCAPTNCSAPIRDAGYRGRALRRARNRTAYPSANVAMAEASRSPP